MLTTGKTNLSTVGWISQCLESQLKGCTSMEDNLIAVVIITHQVCDNSITRNSAKKFIESDMSQLAAQSRLVSAMYCSAVIGIQILNTH